MFFRKPRKLDITDFDKDFIERSLLWFENKLGADFIKQKKWFIPGEIDFEYTHFRSDEAIRYLSIIYLIIWSWTLPS